MEQTFRCGLAAAATLALLLLNACGGAGTTPTPALQASPANLVFGNQRAGTISSSQQVTLRNQGTAILSIQDVELSGADAAAFTLRNGCGATLDINASCIVEVAFAPGTAGAKSASVDVRTNAPAIAPTGLSGNSTVSMVSLNTTTLVLEAHSAGLVSPPQTVTIANTGSATLNIDRILLQGADAAKFVQSNTCTAPIAPGGNCAVEITFQPSASGRRAAILAMQSDAQTNPTVALAGVVTTSPEIDQLKSFLSGQPAVAPYRAVATSLGADITDSATTVGISSAGGFPADSSFMAALNDGARTEYVLVTAGMGTRTWTMIRACNGTAAQPFAAATTSVTWVPLAVSRSSVINGAPLGSIAASFTASVGGASGGTLTAPVRNGLYSFSFSNGEKRNVAVQGGTAVTWSPALLPGTVTAASTDIVIAPEGVAVSSPMQLLTQRFDATAPVYITQRQRLARRGAFLTADLPASGAATMMVDTTAGFQQSGSFMINVGAEDLLVSVADATTLNIVARAQNGTTATALTGSASTFYQVMEVDFLGGGGTQAFYAAGRLNSGLRYLGVAPTVGALREYMPKQPMSIHFSHDGSSFEMLASGNISMLVIVDGVIQHPPNYIVEGSYGGLYWHKFDFGSRKSRKITLIGYAYPMAIAWPATDTLLPWDRSRELVWSFDGDSFGQVEAYSWSSAPNGGGLGLFLEAMLTLGISQFDYAGVVGGTGYSQQGAPSLPVYPRPKYSGANRVAVVAAGPPPAIFMSGLGHNDNTIARPQFAADTISYWTTLRSAWPDTVLVAAQYYFPAAGPSAPEAFMPNPLSVPNEPLILAALRAAGGPWVYIDSNHGTWLNSSGASGTVGVAGQPFITGTGYGGAPGYAGTHVTGVGNGDLMIRDDGVHPSNLGSRHLGELTAAAIKAGVLALAYAY